jgi:hypothetical protein
LPARVRFSMNNYANMPPSILAVSPLHPRVVSRPSWIRQFLLEVITGMFIIFHSKVIPS